jgi:hypothetical protein
MTRLELEASLEAIYLNKMVEIITPEVKTIGRVVVIAVEGDNVRYQIQRHGLDQFMVICRPNTHTISILDHGDTPGRDGADVFADI